MSLANRGLRYQTCRYYSSCYSSSPSHIRHLIPRRCQPAGLKTKPSPNPTTKQFTTSHHPKMRLPYTPNPPTPTSESESAIVSRIAARRAPRPLQPLDLTLLHSPPVADGWNSFLGAIRTQTNIPADLREIAISRVAVANRAWYEWMHHAPLAVQSGVSEKGMEVVKEEKELMLVDGSVPEGLTEQQWVVLCFADEMTRNVQVRDGTFERLRGLFGEREVVEITATISCYNCVSRFLVALDVGEKNGLGPDAAH